METAEAARDILHVDMDAFYASVEQREDPALRGQPVLVGGRGRRGVVAAASYEARRFGVHSAMPMARARVLCPGAVIVPPRMSLYKEVSRAVFGIFRRYTPVVEGLSLDEAFLDVTDSVRLFGPAESIARRIRHDILEETGLTASVGVSHCKMVAKIASDHCKPDGLLCVPEQDAAEFLAPLPVSAIPGVGRTLVPSLEAAGIATLGLLARASAASLERLLGNRAGTLRDRARGLDPRPVTPDRPVKSISSEETFDTDLGTLEDLRDALHPLADRTAARLRAARLVAGTISIKVRRADFTTFTRQQSVHPPTSSTRHITETAIALLSRWWQENRRPPVRLIGVGTAKLSPATQADLFENPHAAGTGTTETKAGTDAVDSAVDDIRARYGDKAIGRARSLTQRSAH